VRGVLVGVLVFFALPALTAASAPRLVGPFVVLNDHFYVKPSFTFEVVSSARNVYVGRSRWRSWSRLGATATTTVFTNTCKPSCGEGRYAEERGQVRLFGVGTCRGHTVFTSFTVLGARGEELLQGSFRRLGYLDHC
jgi:hypothetical protein